MQAILPLSFRENLLDRKVIPFPLFRTGYAPSYLHIHATELLVSNCASFRYITHWHCRSIDFKIKHRRGQNRPLYKVNVNIRLRDNLVTHISLIVLVCWFDHLTKMDIQMIGHGVCKRFNNIWVGVGKIESSGHKDTRFFIGMHDTWKLEFGERCQKIELLGKKYRYILAKYMYDIICSTKSKHHGT